MLKQEQESEITTLSITKGTKERMYRRKEVDETYEDFVKRLMDATAEGYEEERKKKR